MSGVGKPDRGPFGHWTGGDPSGRDYDGRGAALGTGVNTPRDARWQASSRSKPVAFASACASFQSHLRAAAHAFDRSDEEHDDRPGQGQTFDARLLAVADAIVNVSVPSPDGADVWSSATPSPNIAATVVRIADLIEKSARIDLAAGAGAPMSLQVSLGDGSSGLVGMTIVLTPTALDVTLNRADHAFSAELVSAAQALADRLTIRFPKRRVRILDAASPTASAITDQAAQDG
jgi:hypothetical protein